MTASRISELLHVEVVDKDKITRINDVLLWIIRMKIRFAEILMLVRHQSFINVFKTTLRKMSHKL